MKPNGGDSGGGVQNFPSIVCTGRALRVNYFSLSLIFILQQTNFNKICIMLNSVAQ